MSTESQRQQWRELARSVSGIDTNPEAWRKLWVLRDAVPQLLADVDAAEKLLDAARGMITGLADAQAVMRDERDEARALHKLVRAKFDEACAERDALAAELERVRGELAAVPVQAINTVVRAATHAYDMREDRQDVTAITEWLRQRAPEPMLWKASKHPLWTDDAQA